VVFFVFLWLSVKNSIIYEQTEEAICKTRTPQFYVSGTDFSEFFSTYVILLFNNNNNKLKT